MEYDWEESNIMEFQASPVEHLTRVRKAAPNCWKLTCRFISPAPSISTKANMDIPIMENMKIRSMSKSPSEAMAGSA